MDSDFSSRLGMVVQCSDSLSSECEKALLPYGLHLTDEQLRDLSTARQRSLSSHGLVEFGRPSIVTLIEAFAGSPYLNQETLSDDLCLIQEAFYQIKLGLIETGDECFPDETIATALREGFDHDFNGDASGLASIPIERVRDAAAEKEAGEFDRDTLFGYMEREGMKEIGPEQSRDELDRVFEGDVLERPSNKYAQMFYEELWDPMTCRLDFDRRIGGSILG